MRTHPSKHKGPEATGPMTVLHMSGGPCGREAERERDWKWKGERKRVQCLTGRYLMGWWKNLACCECNGEDFGADE